MTRLTPRRTRLLSTAAVAVAVGLGLILGACGSSGGSGYSAAAKQGYLAQVHQQVPDVSAFRSDTGLVRLGAAACTMFASGSDFQDVAADLGSSVAAMDSTDLGSLITAAAEHLCPKYAGLVG